MASPRTFNLAIGPEGLDVRLDGQRLVGVSGVRIRANVAGFYDVELELGAVRIVTGVLEAVAPGAPREGGADA